ncbi:MAG: hypothetical protein FWF77_01260 [Defluviitaleaceae bacterium]|nr:hypothetical protein [Defluviitaleaceae bacterium]
MNKICDVYHNAQELNLADEVRKTVARNDVVNDTLDRTGELLQLQRFFTHKAQKEAAKAAASAEAAGMEKMIITAFQKNAPAEVIEAMKDTRPIFTCFVRANFNF